MVSIFKRLFSKAQLLSRRIHLSSPLAPFFNALIENRLKIGKTARKTTIRAASVKKKDSKIHQILQAELYAAEKFIWKLINASENKQCFKSLAHVPCTFTFKFFIVIIKKFQIPVERIGILMSGILIPRTSTSMFDCGLFQLCSYNYKQK